MTFKYASPKTQGLLGAGDPHGFYASLSISLPLTY